jgi:hypothetical protein
MTLPARFTTLDARLDAFLFATVGEEANGMPLSVASALARLGLDPWTEAGRLAALPQSAAIERLTALIGRIPLALGTPADPFSIATRLVQLLRGAASRASAPPSSRTPRPLQAARWPRIIKLAALLFCFGLIALAAMSTIGHGASLLPSAGLALVLQEAAP